WCKGNAGDYTAGAVPLSKAAVAPDLRMILRTIRKSYAHASPVQHAPARADHGHPPERAAVSLRGRNPRAPQESSRESLAFNGVSHAGPAASQGGGQFASR